MIKIVGMMGPSLNCKPGWIIITTSNLIPFLLSMWTITLFDPILCHVGDFVSNGHDFRFGGSDVQWPKISIDHTVPTIGWKLFEERGGWMVLPITLEDKS